MIDDLLTAVFYRLSCPAPETLADYCTRQLPPGQRLVVARHLRDCPHCARELEMYAAADGEAEGPFDRLRDLVSRVSWATLALASLSPLALRGISAGQQVYQAGDTRIVLELRPATTGYHRWRLLGGVEPSGAATEIELWQESQVRASIRTDDEGYFSFDRLKPGVYSLCLRGDGTETWLEVTVAG